MAGSKFILLSSYYTDHSGLSSSVFHWIRSIAFLFYALRPCFSYFIYFMLQENSCILLKIKSCIILKIKCQPFKFLGLIYMFIVCPPPAPVPQFFVHLAFQYSPLPFLPVSSIYSCKERAFHILY